MFVVLSVWLFNVNVYFVFVCLLLLFVLPAKLTMQHETAFTTFGKQDIE